MQSFTHYFLHFIAIGAIAWFYDKKNWKKNWLILLATMAVDLDHVFAEPLFDPMRCGISYHPLHSQLAILTYFLGMIFTKNKVLRLIFIGLLFHMLTDFIDCLWMFSKCEECYTSSEIYKWIN
ncbi:DUF6122 family protein [Salegentibacter salegens]|uniref:LexA-binding, inner membrane-associated hydrolase n=1 Tax=Salegentibacter salegens TaxID=143223 RepID=A0A1M7IBX6_9FLAO|nr:DUF6122 family protein [Salegentibacter salegens]PRX48022.1 hypothetical protein LY58_01367 [Salegentibacter salegens]SHM38210.1 hypothetical protein SAMN05878281_0491 [Salegentibacter salegens]